MKLQTKIKAWIEDYVYMLRGAIAGVIFRAPPKEYLGYVIENKNPIIIIPGIFAKWAFMKTVADELSSLGHPVYIVSSLDYNLFSIPVSAIKVEEVVRQIHGDYPNTSIIFVAHSKGGLIGKYFLSHYNKEGFVSKMISIATPYSGSSMVQLLPLDSVQELKTDSSLIIDLQKNKEVNRMIVSLSPEYDNHVWAEKGSYLEGAKNISIPVRGHHRILFDERVLSIIQDEVEEHSR